MSAPIVEEEIVDPAGEDSFDSSGTRDGFVRSFEDMPIDLNDVVRDFYHQMSKVHIDRIVEIKTVQRRLEADQLMARRQRVSMIKRIDSLRLENLKVHAMLDIERDHVNSLLLHMCLSHDEFRQVRRDRDDTRERLKRTMTNTRSGMTSATIEEMINQRVDAALEARRVNQDLKLENGNGNGNGNGNTDKKNRLMRIDELHKFSDGTLDDVRTALNDRLKGIRMEYLPQTFWSQRDKANARAMIQAIDKRLKTRRIMRSLERFVGGRPYGGVGRSVVPCDLRYFKGTILIYHMFFSS
ncbi:hypothetical protein Tco_0572452 [Tanacetum coccineum]